MWHQFKISSAEGVAVACGEVREGHLVGAADFRIYLVNLACKAVRRKPFGHCVWIEERAIDFLRRRTEHSVKPDGACGHDCFSFRCVVIPLLKASPKSSTCAQAGLSASSGQSRPPPCP